MDIKTTPYTQSLKALSVHPEFAMQIAWGEKTMEFRSWATKHRGDLLICSTAHPLKKGTIAGHALCIADLKDCVDFLDDDGNTVYAWVLENVRLIVPVPISGKQRLWDFTPEENKPLQIIGTNEYLNSLPEEEDDAIFSQVWQPLIF